MKERLTYYCNSCEKIYAHILEITVVKENGTWGFRCPTCYPPSKVEREGSIREGPYCVGGEYLSDDWYCSREYITKETYRQAKQHPLKKLLSFLFSYAPFCFQSLARISTYHDTKELSHTPHSHNNQDNHEHIRSRQHEDAGRRCEEV